MPVGEKIKEVMRLRGYSQNKLAKAAQISQSGLSSILSGASSPKENTLRAIADALGVSMAYLTEDESDPTPGEDEAWAIRERLRRDPNYRILFKAAETAKPEHLRAAAAMIQALQNEE